MTSTGRTRIVLASCRAKRGGLQLRKAARALAVAIGLGAVFLSQMRGARAGVDSKIVPLNLESVIAKVSARSSLPILVPPTLDPQFAAFVVSLSRDAYSIVVVETASCRATACTRFSLTSRRAVATDARRYEEAVDLGHRVGGDLSPLRFYFSPSGVRIRWRLGSVAYELYDRGTNRSAVALARAIVANARVLAKPSYLSLAPPRGALGSRATPTSLRDGVDQLRRLSPVPVYVPAEAPRGERLAVMEPFGPSIGGVPQDDTSYRYVLTTDEACRSKACALADVRVTSGFTRCEGDDIRLARGVVAKMTVGRSPEVCWKMDGRSFTVAPDESSFATALDLARSMVENRAERVAPALTADPSLPAEFK